MALLLQFHLLPSVFPSPSLTYVPSGMLFSPILFAGAFWTFFILISHFFPAGVHLGEIFFLDSTTTDWFLHVFFLQSCWEQNSVLTIVQPLAILFTSYLFKDTWIWSYERTLIRFCFIPDLSLMLPSNRFLASSYPWCRAAKELFSTLKNSGSQ